MVSYWSVTGFDSVIAGDVRPAVQASSSRTPSAKGPLNESLNESLNELLEDRARSESLNAFSDRQESPV